MSVKVVSHQTFSWDRGLMIPNLPTYTIVSQPAALPPIAEQPTQQTVVTESSPTSSSSSELPVPPFTPEQSGHHWGLPAFVLNADDKAIHHEEVKCKDEEGKGNGKFKQPEIKPEVESEKVRACPNCEAEYFVLRDSIFDRMYKNWQFQSAERKQTYEGWLESQPRKWGVAVGSGML